MAIKIVRKNGEVVIIKDAVRATEEYGNLTVQDEMGLGLARFLSEEITEWWVMESSEQSSEASA